MTKSTGAATRMGTLVLSSGVLTITSERSVCLTGTLVWSVMSNWSWIGRDA